MIKFLHIMIVSYVLLNVCNSTPSHSIPSLRIFFCDGDRDIASEFNPGVSQGYRVTINKTLSVTTQIKVKLDSGSTIVLHCSAFKITSPPSSLFHHIGFGTNHCKIPPDMYNDDARFSSEKDTINNIFTFTLVKNVELLTFTVKGRFAPNHPPYIISLKINGVENCENPDRTYFQNYRVIGVVHLFDKAPDKFCGRRRINRRYTELIVSGSATEAGDWPWHTALMRLDKSTLKYICGGTLISKYVVLTGHCAAINGVPVNPEIMKAVLGKYHLVLQDVAVQEKDIFKVIVHDEFKYRTLENDIALLKLTTEAIFNNYVQPACLWFDGIFDHLGSYEISGTVVGWGFDKSDSLSLILKSAKIPQQPESTCLRKDPIFYSNVLNGQKFCGGHGNGTSACNGDSGGGFVVFVQDDPNQNYFGNNYTDGAWYVKGIVSVSLARHDAAICDPNAFTVFTDVAVYRDWILSHMN